MNLQHKIFYIISKQDIKRKNLREQLNNQISDRALRKLIEIMINDGYLIGTSTRRGYFLIKSEKDYEEAMLGLKKQGQSIFRRANKIHQNFYKKLGQLEYEFVFKED